MSSSDSPFTTWLPMKGGRYTGLSVATSGDRAGLSTSATVARVRAGNTRPVGTRPKSGSHESDRFISISRSSVCRPSKASRP